jgi:ATP-dependent DNA helicase RecG
MKNNDLKFILDRGEGQFIEFKESLDKNFASEIVSFANSSGGKIFLGVSDLGIIKGVKITNPLRSQIQDIARNCDPSIIINFETFENILIIDVKEGNNKPYSCSSGFYMRMKE